MRPENVILEGDCVEVMAGLDAESVDAIVTDPPYDLTAGKKGGTGVASISDTPAGRSRITTGFMGKAWDGTGVAFRAETWERALRVAKPGAHLLAFGGTRTYHRLACAIEDAGWEIRDCLVWAYASGFPKSLNIGGGWGTALKPAWEPIVLARKPLRGTVARNVMEYGTGALNIDATRIPLSGEAVDGRDGEPTADARYGDKLHARPGRRIQRQHVASAGMGRLGGSGYRPDHEQAMYDDKGRWPANVILTDPIFDGDTLGVLGGGTSEAGGNINGRPVTGYMKGWADERYFDGYGDSGTYSRFFLIPKADRADREPVLTKLEPRQEKGHRKTGVVDNPRLRGETWRQNFHPTVKPTDLMRHLVRLVTPTAGLVLDPFLGSGTTAIACELEGFRWLGIEREAEYVAIAEARLNGTQRGLGLSA